MTMPPDFESYTTEQLEEAARLLDQRKQAELKQLADERAATRQAAQDAAWARAKKEILKDTPQAAGLSDEDLWNIFWPIYNYCENWG